MRRSTIIKMAKTKYAHDKNVQAWLDVYYKGTPNIRVKGKSIPGIEPRSEFAYRNLEKSIKLREQGKVFVNAAEKGIRDKSGK